MRTEHTRYYRIKPLKWRKKYSADRQCWDGDHHYIVVRDKYNEDETWSPWRLEWSFCDYYDEGQVEVPSMSHGKERAEADHIKRLLPSLVEVYRLPV